MIGYFPIPYPDEFLYSLCARYQERVGTQFIGHVDQELFGEIMWRHHFTFPHRIGYFLSQLSINMLGTAEDVIRNHTLLPFYLPFLGREKADQFIAGAIGDGVGYAASRLSGTKAGMRSCRYCPGCAKEDRIRYGEAYWHRIHQLPGLPVCPTHKTLLNTPVWHLPNRATARTYQTAEKSIPDEEEAQPIGSTDPHSNLLLWLSRQASWLLENQCTVFDSTELANLYRVTAALKGYERIDSIFLRDFARLARERISGEWLKGLGWPSNSTGSKAPWIHRVLKRGSVSAVRHLLVLWLLNVTVHELSTNVSSELVFEPGPWPCLSTVCSHSGEDTIRTYSLRSGSGRALYGIFECECGFSYRRNAPDHGGSSRKKPISIHTTGHTWDDHLVQRWTDESVNVTDLSLQLGVSRERLLSEAGRLALPALPWRRGYPLAQPSGLYSEGAIRERHRTRVLHSIAMHPDAKRSEVYSMYPSAIMWLRKRDAEWLNRHLPAWRKSKPSNRTKGTRARSWQERDATLAARIPIIAEEFKNIPGPPVRLSIARLQRGVGIRGSGVTNFPKLKAAIEAAEETPFEFVLRKLRQIAKNLPNASPATWADHAGVYKKNWLMDPRFRSALEAVQRESAAWARTSGASIPNRQLRDLH
jgi:Tn7-like transposition protein D/TniQ